MPPLQGAHLKTVIALLSLLLFVAPDPAVVTIVPFFFNRSMNENARLADIVEAVKSLEQAIIKDSGIQCKHHP